jgi:anti-anti-sigma regulatory factor
MHKARAKDGPMTTPMNTWTFPRNIEYSDVPHYLRKFENLKITSAIAFDLSDTEEMHSSFIGFLICAKQALEKKGHPLVLHLSPSIEKILNMFQMLEYFLTAAYTEKKTA